MREDASLVDGIVLKSGMRIGLGVLVYGALAVLGSWAAYSHVFSRFAHYDDQGYVLSIVRSFADGSPLYESTFSQYGPFFALFHRVVFSVTGIPIDLNGAGLVQVGYWVGTATIAGIAAHLSTRRLTLGLLAAASSFVVLSSLRHEPLHPIALIAFLLACTWLALGVTQWWPRTAMALVGALASAVLFTKVNVGFFLAVGLAFGLSVTSRRSRVTVWLTTAFAALSVVMPLLLMRGDITRATNPRFATVIGLSALSLAVVTVVSGREGTDGEERIRWLFAGAVGMALILVGATLATGTGLIALLEGMVLRPLRQPNVFTIPWRPHFLPPPVTPFVVVMTVMALVTGCSVRRFGWVPRGGALSGVKLAAGLLITSSLVAGWPWPYLAMTPLAWVAAVDAKGSGIAPIVRYTLPMVAVLQGLHAYPVAGAQRGVSTFLLIGVAVICFQDAWVLAPIDGADGRPRWMDAGLVGATLGTALLISLGPLHDWWSGNWDEYRTNERLALPGAERYHIEGSRVATYHRLSQALKDRCSTFYSLPGLGSLYVFTGMPPPSAYFATDWMDLLTAREQVSIVETLEDSVHPCIVRYEEGLDLWLEQEEALPDSPLIRHIETEYRVVEEIGPYELLERHEAPEDA